MQNSIVIFTFLFLTGNTLFLVNLVQKLKIASLSWNLVWWLIWICRIQWYVHFVHFPLEMLFLDKSGLKIQNCQFEPKFHHKKTNLNMQNSVVLLFTLSIFDWEYPFWTNLVQKNKTVSLTWDLVPRLMGIWRNQWWC